MKWQPVLLLTASALLSSCGQQPRNETAQTARNAATVDAAEASTGARGVDALVYPGSQRAGDRFSTSDPMDRVVAWYWDEDRPLRERDGLLWAVSKPERRDGGYLVHLTLAEGEDGESSVIYLNPRAGGGTEGRIRPITNEEMQSGVKL